MKELQIALIQMKSGKGEITANLQSIQEYTRQSKAKGTEIICFPEMSITGYIDPGAYPQAVLNPTSDPVQQVLNISAIYQVVIMAGLVEKNAGGKPFITQIAVHNGKLVAWYRKITIADDEKAWFSSGNTPTIFPYCGVNIGLSICADIGNEALFAEYAKGGADIVFESASPGLYGEQATRNWYSGYNWWRSECYKKLGKYAKENQMYIAVSTHAGRTVDEDFPGGGYVFSPEGNCLYSTADWSEGPLYATATF